MEMTGERIIAADRETVWRALNDPEVLKACIPGCERMERTGPQSLEADVTQKVGPVKAKFKGAVTLEDVVEAESYRLVGEGKGGAAGFAKGAAKVDLSDAPEGTKLAYDAEAKVGGKLAQLGSRLIDGFAKKMADEFFDRFKAQVEGPRSSPDNAVAEASGLPAGAVSAGAAGAAAGEAPSREAPASAPADTAGGPGEPEHATPEGREAEPAAASGATPPPGEAASPVAASAEPAAAVSGGGAPADTDPMAMEGGQEPSALEDAGASRPVSVEPAAPLAYGDAASNTPPGAGVAAAPVATDAAAPARDDAPAGAGARHEAEMDAATGDAPADEKKKGWFSRLFG
ncbi:MAG: SRPBCC domain-containing protein [Paracoccaceae bacterium]